jgi:hypothetical protein
MSKSVRSPYCLLLTEAKFIGSDPRECVGSGNWLIVDRLAVLKADTDRGFLQFRALLVLHLGGYKRYNRAFEIMENEEGV